MAAVLVQNTTRTVCVDQYEAYVVQVDGGIETPWPFFIPVNNVTVVAKVSPNVKPQAYISATQGQAACQKAGKWLCKLEEWMSACQGPKNYTFPYGNTYEKGRCNEGRPVNPVIEIFGKNATFNSTEMNDPRLVLVCSSLFAKWIMRFAQLPNTLAPVAEFKRCVSDYEVYDMHGNLDEWVDHLQPSGHGTFKGGFFVDAVLNGPGCTYRTIAHAPIYHDYSLGFRCCANPV